MERGQLQLRSDVLVKCYAVNTVTNQLSPRSDVKLLFRCQFHTSALSSHSVQFSASDLDLEEPAQGHRSLEGLRVEFQFSPTSLTPWSKLEAVVLVCILLCAFVILTLSSPVVSNGYTTKCSKPYWSNPPFLFFLTFGHSGAQS